MSLLVGIFESFLGECRGVNEDSGQSRFDCPECSSESGMNNGDGKGNLEINYIKGVYKCWSCQETNHMYGRLSRLVKRYGTPKNYRDYRILRPDDDYFATEHPDIVVTLPPEYIKFSEATGKEFKHNSAIQYLYNRGITDKIIEEFEIGYCYKGDYYNRIIIPSYNSDGELNYFIARWFDSEYTKMKYKNPIAEKKKIIFNEKRINWDATIYLVEGVFESLIIPNSIPLLGKFISPILLERLYYDSCGRIIIILDDDAYEDAKILYKQLDFCDLQGRIMLCETPNGYDPSLIYEKLGNKGVIALLQTSKRLPENIFY